MRPFFRNANAISRGHLTALLAVAGILLTAPTAGAGGHAGFACPPSYDIGPVTLQQYLALPRHQAGLAAGAFDESFLVSAFTDDNGDGLVCAKDVAALNGGASFWQYVYNIVDDNASAH